MATYDPRELLDTDPRKAQHEPSWSRSYPGGGSEGISRSENYNYGGQDLVYKVGDDLSQAEASKAAALYSGDIAGALAAGRRIADLRAYIDAYKSSGGAGGFYDGTFGAVVPGKRLDSWNTSTSIGKPSGGSEARGQLLGFE